MERLKKKEIQETNSNFCCPTRTHARASLETWRPRLSQNFHEIANKYNQAKGRSHLVNREKLLIWKAILSWTTSWGIQAEWPFSRDLISKDMMNDADSDYSSYCEVDCEESRWSEAILLSMGKKWSASSRLNLWRQFTTVQIFTRLGSCIWLTKLRWHPAVYVAVCAPS